MATSGKKTVIKVVILGDMCVGKTTLMNRYVKKIFNNFYKATMGADFMSKDMIVDGRMVTMQIWDTAGQERFQSLGTAFYRGADCCILTFDITNDKSFVSIENWMDEFIAQSNVSNPDHFPFVLLGNKIDLEVKRAVSSKRALQWCESKKNGIPYYEVSAKVAHNVDEAFQRVATEAIKHISDDDLEMPKSLHLDQLKATKEKSKCFC